MQLDRIEAYRVDHPPNLVRRFVDEHTDSVQPAAARVCGKFACGGARGIKVADAGGKEIQPHRVAPRLRDRIDVRLETNSANFYVKHRKPTSIRNK
ncbi:hypothetical protein GCM10023156_22380 [Novipirellula rosea]|uniref:Uncharacterized protein n=1 Tax=Novipirellula rosea TaxID=1031540 RepID=A0ABP8MP84_9BACT